MKLGHLVIAATLLAVATPCVFAVTATGGNTTNDIGVYRIHMFTNSATADNFVVTGGGNVEVLVVAGGGGGGGTVGGGGGGGGVIYSNAYPVLPGNHTVSVGQGGTEGLVGKYPAGQMGSNSVFVGLTAIGGGGGAGYNVAAVGIGGSAGGNGGAGGARADYTSDQGNDGGTNWNGNAGGGGGGISEKGGDGTAGGGGKGGDGQSFAISGMTTYYGGGGGGGTRNNTGLDSGDGGTGGGGCGSRNAIGEKGQANTGGGGGGGGFISSHLAGGDGGSGIVIVRYKRVIENAAGATNVTSTSAWLNGTLISTGESATAVFAYWGPTDSGTDASAWANTNIWWAPQAAGDFTIQANGLSANSTYYYRFAASNAMGWSWAPDASVFITSEVWINKLSDASESDLTPTPGTFTVHRAAAVTNEALRVNYTVGGSATPGVDYTELSGTVTIPAGETNVMIEVLPVFDHFLEGAETVVLTLVPGPYVIGTVPNATMEIVDYGIVARTWRGAGLNAYASNPTNWAEGEAPITGDAIMLDATHNKNMTWDLNIPVQSWTQDGYMGTVTIATVYPGQGAFTNFNIWGDCVISNGTWTHTANPTTVTNLNNELYRLQVTVNGDMVVGSNAAIDVSTLGFATEKGPGSPVGNPGNRGGGSYGGRGALYPLLLPVPGPCYGSVTHPSNLGSGGGNSAGGGAMLLTVNGVLRHEGVLAANGQASAYHTGSGGSVYLVAGGLIGSGAIRANGGNATGNRAYGGGGRVALVVTNEGAGFSFYNGAVESLGFIASKGYPSSASGTVYLEKYGDVPGNGELIVKGTGSTTDYGWHTDLNGLGAVTYEFSRITLTHAGVLGLLTNNTLILTNTELCADNVTTNEGIALMGGTLIVPAEFCFSNVFIRIEAPNSIFSPASRLTVGTNGVFVVDQPHAMAGDVVIAGGGLLTHTANSDTEAYKIDLTLDGNLAVNEGGRIDVIGKGYTAVQGPGYPSVNYSGGGSYGGHGVPFNTSLTAPCYGSLTTPVNLGSGGSWSAGGGAIRLTVSGAVVNNGQILADGQISANHAGSGGSLFVRAGSLAGNGSFRANGGNYTATAAAGGGGRVALVVTNAGADFSACTGAISAYGGYKTTASGGGAGTVYLRVAGQDVHEGTLIMDNDNRTGLETEISSNVTNTTVGNVLIQRKGSLLLATNQTLTVSGVWSNSATFAGLTDSAVIFGGAAGSTSTIYGATTFMGLTCVQPAKTLQFAAESTNAVAAYGRLILRGDAATNLILRSTVLGTAWHLTVDALAEQDIEFVDVANSDAANGVEVIAKNSVGGDQNNVHWNFLNVTPGETIIWTGDDNTLWGGVGNWSRPRAPVETDVIVIPSGRPNYPIFDAPRTMNRLDIQSGGSVLLNGYDLTVTNNLTVAGELVISDTETVTLLQDADFSGGFFEAARSTVIVAGAAAQSVNLGALTFYKVRVDNNAAAVTLSGGFTATELRCEVPSGTCDLHFAIGKTVTLRDLVLRGASPGATNILLSSTTPGSKWSLAVSGYRSVRGVNVTDSDASVGLPIPALASLNGGGNENWQFGAAPAMWTPTSGDNFHTAANWDPAVVPDAATRVLVESANPMTITGTVSVLDLTVGGGVDTASVMVNGALAVGETVTVLNNGTLTWNRPGVVSNDVIVAAGGLLTHTGNTDAEVNKLNLTVWGDVGVDAAGVVDVTGMGYMAGKGPGTSVGGNSGASYGGRGGIYVTDYTKPGYGSIVAPTNLGSGGANSAGGGAIILKVAGAIRHDGAMIADGIRPSNYYAGSGGTISLRAGSLRGSGLIRANGGDYSSTTSPGGGGRVALTVTNPGTDLTEFTGTVMARGGRAAGLGVPLSGAGTIYRQISSNRPGRGTVEVENGNSTAIPYTDVPPYTNGVPGEVNRAVFHVANGARLRLMNNFTVGDIWLDSANAVLDLGTNTLAVNAREHALGLGTVVKEGVGAIVWIGLPPGVLIIVK